MIDVKTVWQFTAKASLAILFVLYALLISLICINIHPDNFHTNIGGLYAGCISASVREIDLKVTDDCLIDEVRDFLVQENIHGEDELLGPSDSAMQYFIQNSRSQGFGDSIDSIEALDQDQIILLKIRLRNAWFEKANYSWDWDKVILRTALIVMVALLVVNIAVHVWQLLLYFLRLIFFRSRARRIAVVLYYLIIVTIFLALWQDSGLMATVNHKPGIVVALAAYPIVLWLARWINKK
ncbi:MAG TPA: hypothetical protein PLH84_14625 [Candidatus Krumholzibacteria bacterium]|nr:hypothetical protein [Candidatus Krumholzibacteria bacterium]